MNACSLARVRGPLPHAPASGSSSSASSYRRRKYCADPVTCAAPAPAWPPKRRRLRPAISAWAAARAVAPVVKMSSMSKTCFTVTAAGSETVKAPRTFRRRWRGVRPAWLSVARSRISVLEASVSRHSRMALAQECQRVSGQRPRLVEAALGILRPVQRHGNHQHLRRSLAGQLGNRLGQHPAQPAAAGCRRSYLSA